MRVRGFTLLEVLVALVIIALGLMAAFGQINQSVTTASRLRDKTLAQWVALNYLTEMRLKGEFPAAGDRTEEREMANSTWALKVKVTKAARPELRQVQISVARAERPEAAITTVWGALAQFPAQTVVLSSNWVGQRADALDKQSGAPP